MDLMGRKSFRKEPDNGPKMPLTTMSGHVGIFPAIRIDPKDELRVELAPVPQKAPESPVVVFLGQGEYLTPAGFPVRIVSFKHENSYRYATRDEKIIAWLTKKGFKIALDERA
jgi:hypothetical protein